MSAFKDQLRRDHEAVFFNEDEFGETSLYTPLGGSPVSLPAIWTLQEEDEDRLAEGSSVSRFAKVDLLRSKLAPLSRADGLPVPAQGDLLQNEAGELFAVVRKLSSDSYSVSVRVEERERRSIGAILERVLR